MEVAEAVAETMFVFCILYGIFWLLLT